MTKDIQTYFSSGCGRCALFDTPQCKVKTWQKELVLLRGIINTCGLQETMKWGSPCYTFGKGNVLMLGALKDCATIGFFKGTLLSDTENLLVKPGENSQAYKLFKFTSTKKILQSEAHIKAYIFEAVELEKQGAKVAFKKEQAPLPEELKAKFKAMPEFEKAFNALTPGRQRGYLLFFSQAKQSATKTTRIEKMIPLILKGKGMHD
jgi:uncharacterized protein YdeI (YjbR/CyaY-like superfamily)